jgi:hypothetical protein
MRFFEATFAALALLACSSSTTQPPGTSFHVGAHACVAQNSGAVSCDDGAPPPSRPSGACTGAATLCWTGGDAQEIVTSNDGGISVVNRAGLCAACCSGTTPTGAPNASYAPQDCTPIACTTSADCPFDSFGSGSTGDGTATCVDGACQ